MNVEFIGAHVRTGDVRGVCESLGALFQQYGFTLAEDVPAADVLEEDAADEGMGVLVSAAVSGSPSWVSIYVADWPDSGLLARHLSARAPVLEIWCAEGVLWGYTLFADGVVVDRFASDPARMADSHDEQEWYSGVPEKLAETLSISSPQEALNAARAGTHNFAGPGVDALCSALSLPFAHGFTGYDMLLEEDPTDLSVTLEGWPQWRHLLFTHPEGKEALADGTV